MADLTAMTDRYPMDVGQDGMAPMVMKMNVANLYDFATGAGIHRRTDRARRGARLGRERSSRPRRLSRRPGVQRFGVAVRSGLHSIEHHPRQRRHLVNLTGREDDRVTGAELALDLAVTEDPVALDDVIDLVGAG